MTEEWVLLYRQQTTAEKHTSSLTSQKERKGGLNKDTTNEKAIKEQSNKEKSKQERRKESKKEKWKKEQERKQEKKKKGKRKQERKKASNKKERRNKENLRTWLQGDNSSPNFNIFSKYHTPEVNILIKRDSITAADLRNWQSGNLHQQINYCF